MTPATASFLLGLLAQQTIQVGHPDFAENVAKIQAAQSELHAILSQDTPSEEQT